MAKNNNTGKVLAVGAGVAALAAVGYFFFGPNGQKNIKKTKGWMIKFKGDVVDKLENAKEVTEDKYHSIVDSVASVYTKNNKATKEEVADLVKDLKKHWKAISSNTKGAGKDIKNTTKKVVATTKNNINKLARNSKKGGAVKQK